MRLQWLLIICVFLAVAVIHTMSAHDEEREYNTYNEMVCHGYWPDYKRLKPDCESGGISVIL